MKRLKNNLALWLIAATVLGLASCKKDEVTPATTKTTKKTIMDGGPITPPQLPPHP